MVLSKMDEWWVVAYLAKASKDLIYLGIRPPIHSIGPFLLATTDNLQH